MVRGEGGLRQEEGWENREKERRKERSVRLTVGSVVSSIRDSSWLRCDHRCVLAFLLLICEKKKRGKEEPRRGDYVLEKGISTTIPLVSAVYLSVRPAIANGRDSSRHRGLRPVKIAALEEKEEAERTPEREREKERDLENLGAALFVYT